MNNKIDEDWVNVLWDWVLYENNYCTSGVIDMKLQVGTRKEQLLSITSLISSDDYDIDNIPIPEVFNLVNLSELDIGEHFYRSPISFHEFEIPKEIGNLTKLTHLNLSHNELTELPKEIWSLVNLTHLNLSYNELTELPKEIGNLVNLTELWIGGNKLTELPKEIGNLVDLTDLDINDNPFIEFPKEILSLVNLRELNLSHNEFTEFPKEIGNLVNLTELLFWGSSQLTNLPKEITNLVKLDYLGLDWEQEELMSVEQKEWIKDVKALSNEKARKSYLPEHIKVLFVGESPPQDGQFFYRGCLMTKFVSRPFESRFNIQFKGIQDFLEFFKEKQCYLDDLCIEPVDKMTPPERKLKLQENVVPFSKRLAEMKPLIVVSVLKSIEKNVREAVKLSGVKTTFYSVPFPGNGHQTRFKEEVIKILDKHY